MTSVLIPPIRMGSDFAQSIGVPGTHTKSTMPNNELTDNGQDDGHDIAARDPIGAFAAGEQTA